jgi:hypothetical protein
VPFEPIHAGEDVRREGVVRLGQDQDELPPPEDLLEFLRGRVVRIRLDDEPLERVVLLDAEGEVDADRQEQAVDRDDRPSPGDHDPEELF